VDDEVADGLDEVVVEDVVDVVAADPFDFTMDCTGGGALMTLDFGGGEFGEREPAALFARSSWRNGLDRKVTAACSIAARSARMAGLSFASPVAMNDFTLLLLLAAGTAPGGSGPLGGGPLDVAAAGVVFVVVVGATVVLIGRRKVLTVAGCWLLSSSELDESEATAGAGRLSAALPSAAIMSSVGGSLAGIGDVCDILVWLRGTR
jgi:hypothetical protein